MSVETFTYIGTALILGIFSLIAWYVRESITKNRQNWSKVFSELENIKNTQTALTKDLGFLHGKTSEHADRITKLSDKTLEYERRFSILETKIAK